MRGLPDHLRALTPRGIIEVHRQARHLLDSGAKIDRVLHSPYKRAMQTAELVNELFKAPLESTPALVPNGPVERALDLLQGRAENLLIVCHLPIVAEIVLDLADQEIGFFAGTIVRLQREDAYATTAVFDWAKHP